MDDVSPADAGVLRIVGPRLRQLRLERGATLADMVAETGISGSTLSRLESGQRKPTLELLLQLARAHGVPLDGPVDGPETGDPRMRPKPVVRHARTFISLTRRPGGSPSFNGDVGGARPQPALQSHEGYDWLYVLSGRIRLVLGTRDLTLDPGEVVEFQVVLWSMVIAPQLSRSAFVASLARPPARRRHPL